MRASKGKAIRKMCRRMVEHGALDVTLFRWRYRQCKKLLSRSGSSSKKFLSERNN